VLLPFIKGSVLDPFAGSGRKERWVKKSKYSNSGLQKTRTSTFQGVFIHASRARDWAWAPDYVSKLFSRLLNKRTSAFDLAVWLFRDREWAGDTEPEDIVEKFFTQFKISEDEKGFYLMHLLKIIFFLFHIFRKTP